MDLNVYAARTEAGNYIMNRLRNYCTAVVLILTSMGANAQNGLGPHVRGSDDPLFIATEMLGRPTDTSITVNAAAKKNLLTRRIIAIHLLFR